MSEHVTEHFTRKELECKCGCGLMNMQPAFLETLELCRSYYDAPIIITSGSRCRNHNEYVGGKPKSEHPEGWAVDVACSSSRERHGIIRAAMRAGINRIGIANYFLHLGGCPDKPQNVVWLYANKGEK